MASDLRELAAEIGISEYGWASRLSDKTPEATARCQLQVCLTNAADELQKEWLGGKNVATLDIRLPFDLACRITSLLGPENRSELPDAVYLPARDMAVSLLFLTPVALVYGKNGALRRQAFEIGAMISEARACTVLHDLFADDTLPSTPSPKIAA
jgi:hypothetical protein